MPLWTEECDGIDGIAVNTTNTNWSVVTTGSGTTQFDTSVYSPGSTCSICIDPDAVDNHLKTDLTITSNQICQFYMRMVYGSSLIMLWDNTGQEIVLLSWLQPTKKLYAYKNGGGMDLIATLSYGSWYKLNIIPNFENGYYSIYIDDEIQTIGTNTTPIFYQSTDGDTAYLWLQYSSGSQWIDEVQILPPNSSPIADAGSDTTSETDTNITFDGSNSYDDDGSITNWSWNMGDGTTLYGETVTHQYSGDGTFIVTLTVTDDSNATDSDTLIATITDKYPYLNYLLFFIFMFILIVVVAITNWVAG